MRRPRTGLLRRGWRTLACSFALALLAAACTSEGGGTGAQPGGPPQPGGSITIGLETESSSLLPGATVLSASGKNVAMTLFDPLMARTAEGKVVPFLAESLTPNDELTEWTLVLRPGVTFHDGTDLDAQALKTIFDDYLSKQGTNQLKVTMEVVDELTVKYSLAAPYAGFPVVLTTEWGWPFSPTAAKKAGKDAGSQPVGTGPFKLASWRRDDRLVVRKNPDYWREGLPYLDEIVFRPMPDEGTRLTSLQAGDIDAMITLSAGVVGQLRDAADGGQIQTHEHVGDIAGGSVFNTLKPPVDDVRVRRALTHAVDQEDLVAVLGGVGFSPPMTQSFAPDSPWYSEQVAEVYPEYDPGKAEKLLDDYANDPDRSDGKPVGSPVAVEYQCLPDPALLELAQAYQAAWKEVGVQVELKQLEGSAHTSSVFGEAGSQQPFSGDFVIACWRFQAEPEPWLALSTMYGPIDTSFNVPNYRHPDIDAALDELRTSIEFRDQLQAVEAISTKLAEDVPQSYAGATVAAVGLSGELRNFEQIALPGGATGAPMPSTEGAIVYWPEVWLDR